MLDLAKDLLSPLFSGVYGYISTLALFLMVVCVPLILASKKELKKYRKILSCWIVIAVCAGIVMVAFYFFSQNLAKLPAGKTGVLVLNIVGDDRRSLQRDLVSSLNDELERVSVASNIVVRAGDQELDDTRLGVSVAHQKARSIGQQLNARIVVWGNRIEEKKFWPRITIVKPAEAATIQGERQLSVQELDEFKLPQVLVSEPVYLALFLAGLSSYYDGHYSEALNEFESSSQYTISNTNDIEVQKFYAANCCVFLAQSQPGDFLIKAIADYRYALTNLDRAASPREWANRQ